MSYEIILTDIDNTLFDFDRGSAAGVEKVLRYYGVTYTEERLQLYLSENDKLWKQYEQGLIPKDHIFKTRFKNYMALFGIEADPIFANDLYVEGLKEKVYFMPHCKEFLDAVKGKYKLYALTNGVTLTQQVRMERSGMAHYFDGIFISEQMGCKKPEKAFFDKVFEAIGPVDKRKCIMLGDSLTSDMQGGRNAGVDTCLVGQIEADPRCDYIINDLMELLPILEQ